MATVLVENDDLVVEVRGLDKLWSLKSRLTIPLEHVRGATADPTITREPKGLRAPGTHVPGVVVAGTFRQDGGKVFWAVHHPEKAVVIELSDHTYERLVIEVDDPRTTVELVQRALAGR